MPHQLISRYWMRHLLDSHGREWHVYERTSSALSPVPGRRSLVFDADGIVRRIWQYPPSWESLSNDALLGLMDDPASLRRSAAR
jgi:hypothetical protein